MTVKLLKKNLTLVVTALFLVVGVFGVQAQTATSTVLTTGSGSFTVPCGVTSITIRAIGGGGAGASSSNQSKGNGGGGGGAYSSQVFEVTPGQILTYTVGSGGTSSLTEGAEVNGTASTITLNGTVILRAAGGSSAIANAGTGGAGGSAVSSIGTIKNAGGKGGDGIKNGGTKISGGGGASGNSTGAGNPGSAPAGGAAAGTNGGAGGAGGADNENGKIGGNYGGGGGGTNTQGASGGSGGNGVIVLEYTAPPTPVITLPATTPSVCKNQPFSITLNATNVTSITTIGLPAGLTAILNSDKTAVTISGNTDVAGTHNYTITANNCNTATFSGTIIVSPDNTITLSSAAGTDSQTVCIGTPINNITYTTTGATGIGTPTGLPAGVTAVWNSNVITISGTPTASGTFNYSIPLTGGCPSVNAAGTITVGKLTTYNGTTWSDGVPSDLTTSMIVNSGTYITSGNLSACNCTVNAGAALTIASNSSLTLENYLRNNGGTVTVESDGNLVQINNSAANTGNITVKRNARMKRLDYTYWGSPVTGQNLKAFSPGTVNNRFYTYNESDDYFYAIDPINNVFGNSSAGTFESAAKGYAIRANNSYPVWTNPAEAVYTSFEGKFTGAPHNGVIEFPLKSAGNGYNLVGNPYASNIDFHSLAETGAIEGVAYFWTNANPTPATQEGSGYSGLNYATYTELSGGTAALNSNKKPERYIKVGQGFIVKATAAGNLTFNNAMRDNGTGGASTFINKTAATKSEAIDRFWLKLTTPAKNFNTILVAYPKGATNGFESNADAKQLTGSSDEFYSVQNDMKLIIQGRQFPLQNTDKVALGMKNYQAGTYTLSLSEKEGVFANGQAVYLTDSQTGIVTNLSESNYTFTAAAGVADNRFELSYKPQVKVLVTDTATKEKVEVYKDGKSFVIRSPGKKITGLEVYDATGKLMISSAPQQTEARVEAGSWPKGSYILKITRNGEVTTRKVLN